MEHPHIYINIPISPSRDHDHDHDEEALSASATEVEESLMGEEEKTWSRRTRNKNGNREMLSKRESCVAMFMSYRWILDTFLLLVIIGLLLLLRRDQSCSEKTKWQVGGDDSGAGPIFSTHVTNFQPDMRFSPMNHSAMFIPSTIALWKSLMPVGSGLPLQVDDADTFFTTSMTHQLHCVYMMARIFSGVALNATTGTMPADALPEDWIFHFSHCVDYLRQAVMCSADLAREPHKPDDLEEGKMDAGWLASHVCKDYSQVKGYLEGQIVDGARVGLAIDD